MLTGTLVELVKSTDFLHSMADVPGSATAADISRRMGVPAPECLAQLHRLAAIGVVRHDDAQGHEAHYRLVPDEVLHVVMAAFA
jgi:DNA-binding IclR family transcriptional regulator